MSITKHSGDLNEKFGTRLPTPFIDIIKCYDYYLSVSVVIYFDLDFYGSDNFKLYLEDLKDNNVKVGFILGVDQTIPAMANSNYAPYQKFAAAAPSMYTDVIDGKKGALSALTTVFVAGTGDETTNDGGYFPLGTEGGLLGYDWSPPNQTRVSMSLQIVSKILLSPLLPREI